MQRLPLYISVIFVLFSLTYSRAERFIVISDNIQNSDISENYSELTIFGNQYELFDPIRHPIPISRRSISYIDAISESDIEQDVLENSISVAPDLLAEPLLSSALPIIGATFMHSSGYTGKQKFVAVLDTGFDASHPMLSGKIVEEACFNTNDSSRKIFSVCPGFAEEKFGTGAARNPVNIFNSYQHGTHVAAISVGNKVEHNDKEFSGTAPDAGLIAINVFSKYVDPLACFPNSSPCLRSTTRDQIRGLMHVFELRYRYDIVAVVMSLGAKEDQERCNSRPMKYVIEMLRSVGIAVVAAAGNDSSIDMLRFPACFEGTYSVAHTEPDGSIIAAKANRTNRLKISAPGIAVQSAVPGGGYLSLSGSSQAAPLVAGALAVIAQLLKDQGVNNKLERLSRSFEILEDTEKFAIDPRRSFSKIRRLHITHSHDN